MRRLRVNAVLIDVSPSTNDGTFTLTFTAYPRQAVITCDFRAVEKIAQLMWKVTDEQRARLARVEAALRGRQ